MKKNAINYFPPSNWYPDGGCGLDPMAAKLMGKSSGVILYYCLFRDDTAVPVFWS